jgi:hypothetical protein
MVTTVAGMGNAERRKEPKLQVRQHRGTGRNSRYMSRMAVSLPTMDFSLVRTRMDGGRLDPEGAEGRPDLVADAGEDNGGRRSGRRRLHCDPFGHGRESDPFPPDSYSSVVVP